MKTFLVIDPGNYAREGKYKIIEAETHSEAIIKFSKDCFGFDYFSSIANKLVFFQWLEKIKSYVPGVACVELTDNNVLKVDPNALAEFNKYAENEVATYNRERDLKELKRLKEKYGEA